MSQRIAVIKNLDVPTSKKKSVLNKSYASLSNTFFFLDWHGISVIQITFDDAKTHTHTQTNKQK